jgi:ParB-like chromosome segregation protein Spo0J
MKKFNEEKTLANLYLNLKGEKRKKDDWITIANDLKQLCDFYKSTTEAARKLGVSYELVRSILRILDLPSEVQEMIREGRILYDAAQRLARLHSTKKQIEVARAIAGLSSHGARDIIVFAKSNPNAPLDDFRKRVTMPKPSRESIHLTVLPLHKDTYAILQKYSRASGITPQRLILRIIDEWSQKRGATQ